MQRRLVVVGLVATTIALAAGPPAFAQGEPLPSWNAGPARQSIVDFVARVTAAGSSDFVPVPERQAGARTFKVHLDGYNQLPYLTGQQPNSARKEFDYFNDDGDLVAMRYENWKIVFEEQRAQGTMRTSPSSACQSCSTSGPIPTSGPMSRRTPTTTGSFPNPT